MIRVRRIQVFSVVLSILFSWSAGSGRAQGEVVESTFALEASLLEAGVVELDSGWLFLAGDVTTQGPPGPEAPWRVVGETFYGPHSLPPDWSGSGWFQLRLSVPGQLADEALALRLWHGGASEVWLDGERLEAFGTASASSSVEQPFNPRGKPVFLVFHSPGPHILSIRYSATAVLNPFAASWLLNRTGAGFRAVLERPESTVEDLVEVRVAYLGLNLGLSALALGFAIFHFLLFFIHPRHRGNLWFSIFAAALSANGTFESILRSSSLGFWGTEWVRSANLVAAGCLVCAAVAFVEALRAEARGLSVRVLGAAWALVVVANFVPGWRDGAASVAGVLILLSGLATLASVYAAWREKVEGLNSLAGSAVGWLLVTLTEVAKQAGWLGLWQEAAGFTLSVSLVLIGASLFLARKVAAEGRELEALARDLEERVNERTQELRVSEQEALAASRAKSAFLATMSHEIRTPMNAIVGLSDMLSRAALPEEPRQQVGTIHRSARSLLTLLDEVLDLSRVEFGHLVTQQQPFELEAMLREVIDLFEVQADSSEIELGVSVEPALPPRLLGDRARLRQVIVNLMGNALKFTDQGSVTLNASQRHVDLVIEVRDTGIGIEEDALAMLFDPFYQVDDSASRRHQGAGLGLAICQKLMNAMGGTLEVTSELGRGSSFSVVLPLTTPVEPLNAEPSNTQPSTVEVSALVPSPDLDPEPDARPALPKNLKVLLAEDNEINQWVTVLMLEELELAVDVVNCGEAVFEALQSSSYDVILLDLHMPDMDGIEVCARLRAAGNPIQIIAVTASVLEEDRRRCQAAGMDGFLAKPLALEELRHGLVEASRHLAGNAQAVEV